MDELLTHAGLLSWLQEQWQEVLASDIPPDLDPELDALVAGKNKTMRYVVFTQLLGKIADPSRDILAFQTGGAESDEWRGWDGRSTAQKVVVPWEQSAPARFLGGSPEPYANNPVRVPRLMRKRTDVRRNDVLAWTALHDFLAGYQDCDQVDRIAALRWLLYRARRQLEEIHDVGYSAPRRISLDALCKLTEAYLGEKSGGERPLIVASALFETLGEALSLFADVITQKINQPDSTSGALGDITCLDEEGRALLVVEVKDRLVSLQDLQSSIEKLRSAGGLANLLFTAKGLTDSQRPAILRKINQEYVAGINVYHVTLIELIRAIFVLLHEDWRIAFLKGISDKLTDDIPYKHRDRWRKLLLDA